MELKLDQLIDQQIRKIDRLESRLASMQHRRFEVSDSLLISQYDQLSEAKAQLADLQLQHIEKMTNPSEIDLQAEAVKEARQIIVDKEKIPPERLVGFSDYRMEAIYIQLLDEQTRKTYDFRKDNKTKILEPWKNLNLLN